MQMPQNGGESKIIHHEENANDFTEEEKQTERYFLLNDVVDLKII